MLDLVPSDWESALGIRPTGLTAGQQVWRLHRTPEEPCEKLSLAHAFRITTFSRPVFMWAERQLLNGSAAKKEGIIWPPIERQSSDSPLPHLDFDVDFLVRDGRVTVARLNEFNEALEMSEREFALMLLFDGTTTAREAEFAFYGCHGDGVEPGGVDRLISLAARAGLSISPNSE
jgi:hypothetical protein